MEEGGTDANAEVQTGADRNGAETDRCGIGEQEVDAVLGFILRRIIGGERNMES